MTEFKKEIECVNCGELLLFRALWNHSSDNMFIIKVDENGDFINETCNLAQEKTFHLTPHQADGVYLKDILDDMTLKSVETKYNKCIKLKKSVSYEEDVIINNEKRYFSTTILPVIDESKITRIFGISREVTELKKTSHKLQEMNEQLELKVQERTKELEISLENIKKISIRDSLTNLYNRLKLDESLEYELQRSHRTDTQFGLILLDIDHFKNINDRYGHLAGDEVLKEFAFLLNSSLRTTDIFGRWGGEEFLIICPNTNIDRVYTLAQTLRKKIESHRFSVAQQITASFGVTLNEKEDTINTIIQRVDDVLYRAKNNSRNCVFRT
jgi:diguanylate cyclase (GGDEF)-like protein/PAS domain S-box-containing protein